MDSHLSFPNQAERDKPSDIDGFLYVLVKGGTNHRLVYTLLSSCAVSFVIRANILCFIDMETGE